MKERQKENRLPGFTRVELLAVIACVALLAITFLPAQTVDRYAVEHEVECQNNLKQVGLAFRIWDQDYGDHYPMSVPTAKGGSQEALAGTNMFRHFAVMSNVIMNPRLLICPADDRQPARDLAAMSNTNLSYFAGLDADETRPTLWLDGDRNLVTNGVVVVPGMVVITPKDTVTWSDKMHGGAGNIGLADGSVRQTSSASLQSLSGAFGTNVNRLAVP